MSENSENINIRKGNTSALANKGIQVLRDAAFKTNVAFYVTLVINALLLLAIYYYQTKWPFVLLLCLFILLTIFTYFTSVASKTALSIAIGVKKDLNKI